MIEYNYDQFTDVVEKSNLNLLFKVNYEDNHLHELEQLTKCLTPDSPWGDRQIAAKKLGYKRDSRALPCLLYALLKDPFWMVRCSIIQAIEMIGDQSAIPVLMEALMNDSYQVVRSYAAKAIQRLS
jgi:HEAT repeat protein